MKVLDRDNIEIKGKKVVVLGLALSGVSAAYLAAHKDCLLYTSDAADE